MPIYGISDDIEETIVDKDKTSLVPRFESDTNDVDVPVMLPGFDWTVTYFHRVVVEDNLVTAYDSELDITLQDYVRIDNFLIKVSDPLSTGNVDDISGSGVVDLDITPTPNDLILTKIPDGRTVLLVITDVDILSYSDTRLYTIEYRLHAGLDSIDDPVFTKLLQSTVDRKIYNKDYRIDNTTPLYSEKEVSIRKKFLSNIENLMSVWVDAFISPSTYNYLGYIDDGKLIYDPLMEHFINDIIGISKLPTRTKVLLKSNKSISILDYIVNSNMNKSRIYEYTLKSNVETLNGNPFLMSLLFSGINDIIEVVDIANNEDEERTIVNEYYPKVSSVSYIFSNGVYRVIKDSVSKDILGDDITLFESVFIDILNGVKVDHNDLLILTEEIYMLDKKEMFYYIPILTYLKKYYLTTFTIKFV